MRRSDGKPSLTTRLMGAYFLTIVLLIAFGLVLYSVLDESDRIPAMTGLAFIAAAGLVTIMLVARRAARSIQRLAELPPAIASGTFQQYASEGTAEVAELADALAEMATRLNARFDASAEDRLTRELILSAMNEGVALVDERGRIQYLNPAAERLLGWDRDGERGPPALIEEAVGQARSGGPSTEVQLEVGHPPRVVRALALPVDPDGRVLVVVRDVTEAARVEAIRKDFAAAASHELKTPVATIRATAETLHDVLQSDPEASRRFAAQLINETERLSRVVADLLDLSRLESERPSLETTRLDLIAEEETARLREPAVRKKVSMSVVVDGPVEIKGSSKDVALALRNLIDNAVEYNRPGGNVKVDVAQRNGAAVVSVTDTGVGIPAKDLPRIFERFYRVDRARSRETGGTGLGLALVKHVAEQYGGRVEAESELGKGSTFRITLPLAGDS